jgi:lysophospholipase L1-like esterase
MAARELPDITLSGPKSALLSGIDSYVAIGDSFTEGLGDPGPDGSLLGWADRFAGRLAGVRPGLMYANLAVRGKLLHQIIEAQLPTALELQPTLLSLCAGGNDVLRPGGDPDKLAAEYEQAVVALRGAGAHVMVFTGFDTRDMPFLKLIRGKVATYNENLRVIADKYDCTVVDLWGLEATHDKRAWSEDRLHLSAEGHERVALKASRAMGLETETDPNAPWPAVAETEAADKAAAARFAHVQEAAAMRLAHVQENVQWAREHLAPWIGRRLRGESSGDGLTAKRPDLSPLMQQHKQDA